MSKNSSNWRKQYFLRLTWKVLSQPKYILYILIKVYPWGLWDGKWLYVSLGTASGQDDSQPGTRFFWKYSYTSSGNRDPGGDTADQHTPTVRDFGDVSSQRTWKGRNPSTIWNHPASKSTVNLQMELTEVKVFWKKNMLQHYEGC